MKFAVYSDAHVHNYKQFDTNGSRLDNTLLVLDHIYYQCHNQGIKLILFCGDIFDSNKAIPVPVLNAFIAKILIIKATYPDIRTISITGNHDHATRNTIETPAVHSQEFINTICGDWWTVIDNQSIIIDGVKFSGIPYYGMIDDFHTSLNSISQTSLKHYLAIHQTPVGIKNKYIPSDHMNDIQLKNFNHVFCGHIHQHETLSKNLTVVGSPLHRDFGDAGEENGLIVYDTDFDMFDRILLPFPKFQAVAELTPESGNYQKEVMVAPDQKALQDSNYDYSDNDRATLFQTYWEQHEGTDKEILDIGYTLL